MLASVPLPRALMVAGLLVLGLTACGRRGALEAPPDPSTAQKTAAKQSAGTPSNPTTSPGQTEEEAEDSTLPSPVGTPRKSNSKRGYVIPKEPFFLDPIL